MQSNASESIRIVMYSLHSFVLQSWKVWGFSPIMTSKYNMAAMCIKCPDSRKKKKSLFVLLSLCIPLYQSKMHNLCLCTCCSSVECLKCRDVSCHHHVLLIAVSLVTEHERILNLVRHIPDVLVLTKSVSSRNVHSHQQQSQLHFGVCVSNSLGFLHVSCC